MPVRCPKRFGDPINPGGLAKVQEGHASGEFGTKLRTPECCQVGDSYLDDS